MVRFFEEVPASGAGVAGRGLFPVVAHLLVVSEKRLLMVRERSGGWVFPSGLVPDGLSLARAALGVSLACVGAPVALAGVRTVHVQFDRAVGVVGVFVQVPRLEGVPTVVDRVRFDGTGWYAPDRLPVGVAPSLVAAVVSWGGRTAFSEFPVEERRAWDVLGEVR